jgi:hypothetical protein
MFMDLRPSQQTVTTTNGLITDTTVVLANKTEVSLPEDLEPVVVPDGATMQAAQRSVSARNKKVAWLVGTGGAIGVAAFLVGGFQSSPPFHLSQAVSWPIALAIVGAPYLVSRHYQHVELDERKAAFSHYTRDLGDRLNVCSHELQVVACDGPDPTPPTSVPPQTSQTR